MNDDPLSHSAYFVRGFGHGENAVTADGTPKKDYVLPTWEELKTEYYVIQLGNALDRLARVAGRRNISRSDKIHFQLIREEVLRHHPELRWMDGDAPEVEEVKEL